MAATKRVIEKLLRRARWFALLRAGAKITYNIQINSAGLLIGDARCFSCGDGAMFLPGTKINVGAQLVHSARLSIGSAFYMNYYSVIDCYHQITIGNRVQFGPNCYVSDFDHDIALGGDLRGVGHYAPVHIEDEVWLGAGVTVLKGVRIGAGAIVGAGSVVTRDVAANSVVAGVPARFIKMRPGAETVETSSLMGNVKTA